MTESWQRNYDFSEPEDGEILTDRVSELAHALGEERPLNKNKSPQELLEDLTELYDDTVEEDSEDLPEE